jgi:hypothetical protein
MVFYHIKTLPLVPTNEASFPHSLNGARQISSCQVGAEKRKQACQGSSEADRKKPQVTCSIA